MLARTDTKLCLKEEAEHLIGNFCQTEMHLCACLPNSAGNVKQFLRSCLCLSETLLNFKHQHFISILSNRCKVMYMLTSICMYECT